MTEEDAEKYLQLLGQELQRRRIKGEILVHDDIKVILDIRKPKITDIEAYLADDSGELENINAYFGGHGLMLRDAIAHTAKREKIFNN